MHDLTGAKALEQEYEDPGSMVLVKWTDASHHGGWSYEPGLALSIIVSIGFVIKHDAEMLTIGQGIGFDGHGVLNELSIPSSSIQLIDHPTVADVSPFISPVPPFSEKGSSVHHHD